MNIIIAGCTCSGKTTLANELSEDRYSIMPEDAYFKNLNDMPKYRNNYLMDSINAFCSKEYELDSKQLINQGFIYIPEYDIKTNTRINKNTILKKTGIVIFEGLHTITILNSLPDSLKIFIDTDLEECLIRRVIRDKENYGLKEETIRKYFYECVIPMYKAYIYPQIESADVVLKKEDDIKCLLKRFTKN